MQLFGWHRSMWLLKANLVTVLFMWGPFRPWVRIQFLEWSVYCEWKGTLQSFLLVYGVFSFLRIQRLSFQVKSFPDCWTKAFETLLFMRMLFRARCCSPLPLQGELWMEAWCISINKHESYFGWHRSMWLNCSDPLSDVFTLLSQVMWARWGSSWRLVHSAQFSLWEWMCVDL